MPNRRPLLSGLRPRTLGFLALLFLLAIAAFFMRDGLASLMTRGAAPMDSARAATAEASESFFAVFRSKAALSQENENMKSALAALEAKIADRDTLKLENKDLKTRLGRADTEPRRILGGILMRPPEIPYDALLIDAGAEDGVTQGSAVSAGGDTVIGEITEVYATTARVALLSSPSFLKQALLSSAAASGTTEITPVTLEGAGAGNFFTTIPASQPAAVGDSIVLPGILHAFAGAVAAIDAPEGNSFKTLYLHLPVNLFELRYVEVWVP